MMKYRPKNSFLDCARNDRQSPISRGDKHGLKNYGVTGSSDNWSAECRQK